MSNIVTLLCWCWIICISINIFEFYSKTCLTSLKIICSLYLMLSLFMLYFLVKLWMLWLSWIPSSIYLIQEDHTVLHYGLFFLNCCLETLSSHYSGSMLRLTSFIFHPSGTSALWCLLPNVLRHFSWYFVVFVLYVLFSQKWKSSFSVFIFIFGLDKPHLIILTSLLLLNSFPL